MNEGDWYTMKSTGIVRGIDALGRIVLPKELRTSMNLDNDAKLEIFVDGDSIVLKKAPPHRQLRFLRRGGRQVFGTVCGYCICPACRKKDRQHEKNNAEKEGSP